MAEKKKVKGSGFISRRFNEGKKFAGSFLRDGANIFAQSFVNATIFDRVLDDGGRKVAEDVKKKKTGNETDAHKQGIKYGKVERATRAFHRGDETLIVKIATLAGAQVELGTFIKEASKAGYSEDAIKDILIRLFKGGEEDSSNEAVCLVKDIAALHPNFSAQEDIYKSIYLLEKRSLPEKIARHKFITFLFLLSVVALIFRFLARVLSLG